MLHKFAALSLLLAVLPPGYCTSCPSWSANWSAGTTCYATSAQYSSGIYNLQAAKVYVNSSVQLELNGGTLRNVTFVSLQTSLAPSAQPLLRLGLMTSLENVVFHGIASSDPIIQVLATATVDLEDCQFSNNRVTALRAAPGSTLNLNRVRLIDSNCSGGHVATDGTLRLNRCTLRNLSAHTPIVLATGSTTVTQSKFEGCTGSESGGALALRGSGTSSVSDTTFRFCRSLGHTSTCDRGADCGNGGALFAEQSIDLRDSLFEHCASSKYAGGANIEGVVLSNFSQS
jgi:hypothetical protein